MPHIHTGLGQVDFVVNVYVVFRGRVLLRMHEKYHRWLPVGGHIELSETPEEAAIREVKEETGLTVSLWMENKESIPNDFPETYKELTPPLFMNVHALSDAHRHIALVYFAKSESDDIIEPDTNERSGGCLWITKKNLVSRMDVDAATKYCALRALDILGG